LAILKSVLSRHGAVPMSSSLVGFTSPDTPPNAAVLLDRSAAVLALRHEMRGPFAAWLARQVPPLSPTPAPGTYILQSLIQQEACEILISGLDFRSIVSSCKSICDLHSTPS